MTLPLAIDLLLMAMLVWLAWASLSCASLFRGVVLFMVFGLLMALAWARLHAPDIALAEAAIGSGLTGLLLLRAVHGIAGADPDRPGALPVRFAQGVAVLLVIAGLASLVSMLAVEAPGLAPWVTKLLPESGVEHPVTAVLLNFRAYDTLLEVAVLMVALLGAAAAGSAPHAPGGATARAPVFQALMRYLVPLIVLVAGYLLWRGADAPGGAFQAGALLAGAGVLLSLGDRWRPTAHAATRAVSAAGFALFLALALGMMLAGGHFLEYPRDAAGALIILIELALTVSIGLILLLLVVGASPRGNGSRDA
jgi:multisubunit Na+/H+ antiporter MnhB subunit